MEAASSDEDELSLDENLPPLPGHKDHNCTDASCLLAIFVALAVQGYICFYAATHGDLTKITRGYNSEGKLCGVQTEGRFLFHCGAPGGGAIIMAEPICVSECPARKGNGTHSCFNPEVDAMQEFPDYATDTVLNFCLPVSKKARAAFIHERLGNISFVYDDGRMVKQLAASWLPMIRRAWLPLLLSANLAAIVGYAYLLMLDRAALQLVYVCEIVVTCGSWGAGGYLLQTAIYGAGSDGLEGTGDSTTDFLLGVVCIVSGFAACCVSLCANRSLPTAVGCVEATCECMFQEPTLLLEPFLSLASKVVVAIFFSATFLALIGCGDMHIPAKGHNGFVREFSFTPLQYGAIAFTCCMFVVLLEVCHHCSRYTLSWTTQMWYFTPYVEGEKRDKKPCLVFRGYANALRYHIGSLTLGAVLVLLFRPFRLLIRPLAVAAKEENGSGRSLSLMCPCCVSWYWTFLAKIKKTAWMDMAITSDNYFAAAARSLDVMRNELDSVWVLDGAMIVFQLALLGICMYTGFISTLWMTSCVSLFSHNASPYYIEDPKLVAVVAAVICGFVGMSFMLVFDTVGHTILYCYGLEHRRHRESLKYMDKDVAPESSYIGWLIGGCVQCDEERQLRARVDYAPPQLHDLLAGGRNPPW